MADIEFTVKQFYEFLEQGKLMGSRCTQCKTPYLPPRPICPKCFGSSMEWVAMKGTGKLAAFTTVAVGNALMVEEGYDRNKLYCSGIVQLEEGPKISAQILGVDEQNPASIKIGSPVNLEPMKRQSGQVSVGFRISA